MEKRILLDRMPPQKSGRHSAFPDRILTFAQASGTLHQPGSAYTHAVSASGEGKDSVYSSEQGSALQSKMK